jgi:hypothetical protein
MHQVQLELTDQLYDRAKRRAVEAGFESVTDYIADVVFADLAEDIENLDPPLCSGKNRPYRQFDCQG